MHIRFIPKLLWCLGAVAGLVLCLQAVTHAQVILHDSVSADSAFMFIAPDDQPVAKTVSEIHFRLKPALLMHSNRIELHISSETGGIHEHVPVSIMGSQVTGLFNFPVNGVYKISLEVVSIGTDKSTIFERSVHVVRSLGPAAGTRVSKWPIAGLFLSASSVAALILLAFSHRKNIK